MTIRTSPDIELSLPPHLAFLQTLWSLDHALSVMSRRMVRRLGLTGPQRLVIRLLGRFPGTSPGFLAKMLRLHPGTVTRVLRRLEERRLVLRSPDPEDGRRSPFSLTRAGQALDKTDPQTVEAAVGRMLARLPRGHIDIARQVLAVLEEELVQ